MKDDNGAGFGHFGTDPQSGLPYILDRTTRARVYRHKGCKICGVSSWWSTPEPQPCAACKLWRVARNENVSA